MDENSNPRKSQLGVRYCIATCSSASCQNFILRASAISDYSDRLLEIGINPNCILQERLYEDMEPFVFQVWNTVHASLGAVRALREGEFGPPPPTPEGMDFAGLQKIISQARGEMLQLQRDEIELLQGKTVTPATEQEHRSAVHGRRLRALFFATQLFGKAT